MHASQHAYHTPLVVHITSLWQLNVLTLAYCQHDSVTSLDSLSPSVSQVNVLLD